MSDLSLPPAGRVQQIRMVVRGSIFPLSECGLLLRVLYRDEYFRNTCRYTLTGRSPNFRIRAPGSLSKLDGNATANFRLIAFPGCALNALYLVHQVVLAAVGHEIAGFGATTRGLCALAVNLAIAWILYIAIKKPFARLRDRVRA